VIPKKEKGKKKKEKAFLSIKPPGETGKKKKP